MNDNHLKLGGKQKQMINNKSSIPKVWISGAWAHRERMGQLIDQVRQMGYEITHDWTRLEKAPNPSPQEMGMYAKFDIDGVKNADVVVAVLEDPDYPYRGTFTEIGCALGANKPTHIVWPYSLETSEKNAQILFFWHPDIIYFKSWDDFIDYLKKTYPLK